MPSTTRAQRLESRLEDLLLLDGSRFVDYGVQYVIHKRDPNTKEAVPVEKLWPVYGGIYDRLERRYIGPPTRIVERPLMEAFVDFVMGSNEGVIFDLALGAMGAGKTTHLALLMERLSLERPNTTYGGVGATDDRRLIVWNAFLELMSPQGMVKSELKKAKEIHLWTNVIWQIVATTAPSETSGTPVQGKSWSRVVGDEWQSIDKRAKMEIFARGRRAGPSFCVSATGTNQLYLPDFAEELDKCERTPKTHKVRRISGYDNCFIPAGWYDRTRGEMSERDFEMLIECKPLPPEYQVYHQYKSDRNLRTRPPDLVDITEQVTANYQGGPYRYMAGLDFGVLVNCAEIMKCYRGPDGEHLWWVIDEIDSRQSTFQAFARDIMQKYYSEDILAIGDPHPNIAKRDLDKSPYLIMRKEGLRIFPAVSKGFIATEHRVAMMNSLLCDANGKSRLFIDTKQDYSGKAIPVAPKLHRAFLTETRTQDGRIEGRKTLKHDMSHYPTAVGYGLYREERFTAGQHLLLMSTGEVS